VVTAHHAIEDAHLFRDLRRGDPSLGPVVDRLAAAILPHLRVEEDQLLDPIARLDIRV
jgi:hypothetical protein